LLVTGWRLPNLEQDTSMQAQAVPLRPIDHCVLTVRPRGHPGPRWSHAFSDNWTNVCQSCCCASSRLFNYWPMETHKLVQEPLRLQQSWSLVALLLLLFETSPLSPSNHSPYNHCGFMVTLKGGLHCYVCGLGSVQLRNCTAGDVPTNEQSAPQEVKIIVASVGLHGLFGEWMIGHRARDENAWQICQLPVTLSWWCSTDGPGGSTIVHSFSYCNCEGTVPTAWLLASMSSMQASSRLHGVAEEWSFGEGMFEINRSPMH